MVYHASRSLSCDDIVYYVCHKTAVCQSRGTGALDYLSSFRPLSRRFGIHDVPSSVFELRYYAQCLDVEWLPWHFSFAVPDAQADVAEHLFEQLMNLRWWFRLPVSNKSIRGTLRTELHCSGDFNWDRLSAYGNLLEQVLDKYCAYGRVFAPLDKDKYRWVCCSSKGYVARMILNIFAIPSTTSLCGGGRFQTQWSAEKNF